MAAERRRSAERLLLLRCKMSNKYSLGIDVGSTTVKTVITDADGEIIYSKYQRHLSKVKETVTDQLKIIQADHPNEEFTVCITGSAGLGLANSANIPFVQEVHAAFLAVKQKQPDADAVIELGGEDAKIIFLTGGVEQRMNGTCAGGTGAFIWSMKAPVPPAQVREPSSTRWLHFSV